MTDFEYNRKVTASDFLSQTLEVRDERRDVPLSDVLDSPLYCLKFNEDWKPHLLGAIGVLQSWTAWNGADDDTNTGTRQITKLLAQDMTDCGSGEPCSIEVLLADDEFFNDEYLPMTFGDKYSNAQTRNGDLETDYDGTPQSIGSSIPVGTPNDEQKNALCVALLRFVKLYCSEKICIIQSRSFGEIVWDAFEDAAEAFYGNVLDKMLGAWSDNLFGCIIDIPTALVVLADESAQETLSCYLLDQLDGNAISETAFNTAIDNAAISLSGNAQDIACVMSEDMAQIVYLNFLEAYNTALIQSQSGDAGDCPCISASYRVWRHSFENGLGDFTIRWVSNIKNGTLTGGRIEGPITGTNKTITLTMPLDPTWRVKGARVRYSRGGTAAGQCIIRWRPVPDSNTGALNPSISNGLVLGNDIWACQNNNAPVFMDGLNELFIVLGVAGNTGSHYIYMHEIEILYYANHAPSTTYPTADDNLCA